jgi:hypothetical protein
MSVSLIKYQQVNYWYLSEVVLIVLHVLVVVEYMYLTILSGYNGAEVKPCRCNLLDVVVYTL